MHYMLDSLSFSRKARLFLIKFVLKIVVFIDFLQDIPVKVIKISARGLYLTLIFSFFLSVLAVELKNNTLHNLFYYLITRPTIESTEIPVVNYPIIVSDIELPELTSKSVLVMDVKNDKVLYEDNPSMPLPPASTTKLMTAIISRELYEQDQVLVMPAGCVQLNTSRVGFEAGEEISVKDLTFSLLISSAGDSACAFSVDSPDFITRMNAKALELNMKNTNFTNSVGLDAEFNLQVSSAEDLYILAKAAMEDPLLRHIVNTKEYTLTSGNVERKIFNTNDLLWDIPQTVGIKTGRTYAAGEVLVYEYRDDNKDLVIIVMGSEDRFGDTKALLGWALASYDFGE